MFITLLLLPLLFHCGDNLEDESLKKVAAVVTLLLHGSYTVVTLLFHCGDHLEDESTEKGCR
jgi:NhaP-type Na+/H+ or K+/H+ antiporter